MKRRPHNHDATPPLPGFAPIIHIPVIRVPQPNGDLLIRAGKPVVLGGEDEISTTEAAAILGCTLDWVGRLCDRGTLIEGVDWRRIGDRGLYRIKRASVIRLAYPNQETD